MAARNGGRPVVGGVLGRERGLKGAGFTEGVSAAPGRRLIRRVLGPSGPFGYLWASATASNLADGFFKMALPLWVATSTGSPGLVAGVMTALSLPWLVLSVPAGSLIDHADRRRLMLVGNLLRVGLVSLIIVLTFGPGLSLAALYAIAFALGTAEVLTDTATSAIVPAVVPRGQLEQANARLVGSNTVGNEFVGPAFGGALFGFSPAAPFAASAALYLAAAAALRGLRGSFRAAPSPHLVRSTRPAGGGHAAALGSELLSGLTTPQYGLLLTCLGVGGVLGTVLAAPTQRWLGQRWAIGADILGASAMLLAPALSTNPWVIGTAALLGGIGGTMWGIVVSSLRQRMVPDALLGRVSAALKLFGYGALPLGAALAGAAAELFSIRTVFAGGALLTLLMLIPFFLNVTRQALEAAQAPGEQGG